MSFHSLEYLLFLPLAVTAFFLTPHRWRWIILLAASVIFYASWRLEFLWLLLVPSIIDYAVGLAMPAAAPRRRKLLLTFSLTTNLGLLGFFKFFTDDAMALYRGAFDTSGDTTTPMLFLLPLGISFYTFQTLSYAIDVYRGKRPPERHLGHYLVYVMYFPQLIAGPIERFGTLMPQLKREQVWDWSRVGAGGAMILLGLYKKLVIADGLGVWLGVVAGTGDVTSGLQATAVALGTLYRFYADLSGYADIALGSALIMGVKLTQNFRRPLAAGSVSAFWQRWHVTVTNWFRDYVYIPLARNWGSKALGRPLATLITLVIIGVWHGASAVWLSIGIVAGLIIGTSNALRKKIASSPNYHSGAKQAFDAAELVVLWLYLMGMGAMVGAGEMMQGLRAIALIAQAPQEILDGQIGVLGQIPAYLLIAIALLELFQWFEARKPVHDRLLDRGSWMARGFYLALIALIIVFGTYDNPDFLYFAF